MLYPAWPFFTFRSFLIFAVLALLAGLSNASAQLYYDTDPAANLQGGSGTWDAGTTAQWSTSTSGSSPLVTWTSGDTANFTPYASGPSVADTVTVSGTVSTAGISASGGKLTGLTLSSGTLSMNTGGSAVGFNFNGVTTSSFAATINSGVILLSNGAGTIYSNNVGSSINPVTINGIVSGSSSLYGIAVGSLYGYTGNLTLGGANTYIGATSILSGTLSASNIVVSSGSSNLGNATSAVTLGGFGSVSTKGTLSYTGNSATYTRGFTLGTSGLGGEVDVTTAGQTLTIATGNVATNGTLFTVGGAGNTTITSTISGTSGTLAKTGAGTLTLASGNTYTGTTTVSGGTLAATNTTGSATGSGALAVQKGGALAGSGIISGSSFALGATGSGTTANVYVGQTAATGDTNTTGKLTLLGSGASTIANANLSFNLNSSSVGGSGALNVDGTGVSGTGNELVVGTTGITFGSNVTLTLNVQGATVISPNTPFVLFAGTGTGSGLNGSQYSGLTSGGTDAFGHTIITGLTLSFAGSQPPGWYANSYLYLNKTGGVDDIEIEVIPEPSTWAEMLGGLALLLLWQRRRSRLD